MNIKALDFNNFGTDIHTWFHPSVTLLHDGRLFAVMQTMKGSDHYGGPCFSISADKGENWSAPTEIPAFKNKRIDGTPFVEGVADIRPFTLQDGSVAVFGCTTFYTDNGAAAWDKQVEGKCPAQSAVYAIWSPETEKFGTRGILELPGIASYRAACTQAILDGDDRIVVPIYFNSGSICDYHDYKMPRFASLTAVYRKQGDSLEYVAKSNSLELPILRGCIEPSIVRLHDGRYAMTLRAEDGKMYRAIGDDTLSWHDMRPWQWDDGTTIKTESTQQHWITLGQKAFLVYTRSNGENNGIMRFRAPLYIAEADAERAMLFRSTEKIVFPRQCINGVEALYGNFHCAQLDDKRAIVSDSASFRFEREATIVMAALVTDTEYTKLG